MVSPRFFDGFGNGSRNNYANNDLGNRNQNRYRTRSSESPVDLNGHRSFTSMSLNDSPAREAQSGNHDAPRVGALPPTNVNEPDNNRGTWLSLSLPGTNIREPDNPTTVAPNVVEPENNTMGLTNFVLLGGTSTATPNQTPTESNSTLNPINNTINVRLNCVGLSNITILVSGNPVVICFPRPEPRMIEFGGRMVRATPVLTNALRPIVMPDHALGGTVVHSINHSILFVRQFIEKGIHSFLMDDDELDIGPGEFLQLLRYDNEVDLWERDDLLTQISRCYSENRPARRNRILPSLRLRRSIFSHANQAQTLHDVIVLSSDDEEDDNMDVEAERITINDEDDGAEMITDPEEGYQIVFGDAQDEDEAADDIEAMSYEEILRMQEDIGDVSVGIPSELIDIALRIERRGRPDVNDRKGKTLLSASCSASTSTSTQNSNSCVICLESFKPSDMVGILYCDHEFHYPCLRTWLEGKNSCPLCRKTALELFD